MSYYHLPRDARKRLGKYAEKVERDINAAYKRAAAKDDVSPSPSQPAKVDDSLPESTKFILKQRSSYMRSWLKFGETLRNWIKI
jgi:hypothetical protein